METLITLFTTDFALRALLAGTLASLSAGVLGCYVVAGRHSVFSDMLAHTSLAGVGIGLFLGFSPTLGALGIAFLSGILLWFFTRKKAIASEAIAMVLLTGGLALALLFAHFAKDNPIALDTYLFGSILTVRPFEIWLLGGVFVGIGLFLVFFGHRLRSLVLDPLYTESRFSYSGWLELVFFLCLGLIVGLSLKIIGGLLIGALLVIPAVSASFVSKSFRVAILWSVFLGVLASFLGVYASFMWDVPTGSAIVLALIGELFLVSFSRAIVR